LAVHDELLVAEATGRDLVVCFDSLTALCEHATLEEAFRLVHLLSGRFRAADTDVRSVFYLDPSAHDRQCVETLAPLFDRRLG